MSGPAFDELLKRLVTADVQFVLVGGLALNAWGVVRGTQDVDIVVDPESRNLSRLAQLVEARGSTRDETCGGPASGLADLEDLDAAHEQD